MSTQKKLRLLKSTIRSMESVLVAYSGGVDSSFLLKISKDCLKNKMLAVTAVSETYTKKELEFAKRFCRQFDIKHKIIKTHELSDVNFNSNPKDRCYFCKKELFSRLKKIAFKNRIKNIVDATNADDRFDFRPGAKAKRELCVRSPLDEINITKKEIRSLSKKFRLSSWGRPQMACLASRMQYGTTITRERLRRIEKAEDFIRENLGIGGNIRVRDYGDLARIEVDKADIPKLIKADGFMMRLKRLGFRYVTVDLEGYRTGSMNEKKTQFTERSERKLYV